MIIVTGGAGFIGSCVVRSLNDRGIDDIIIVDNIAETDKWRNMANKRYIKYYNRDEFLEHLPEYAGRVTNVFHLVRAAQQQSVTLITFTRIILSTPRHCGSSAQTIMQASYTQAALQHMVTVHRDLTIRQI